MAQKSEIVVATWRDGANRRVVHCESNCEVSG